jgi:hypothetical protein
MKTIGQLIVHRTMILQEKKQLIKDEIRKKQGGENEKCDINSALFASHLYQTKQVSAARTWDWCLALAANTNENKSSLCLRGVQQSLFRVKSLSVPLAVVYIITN